MVDDATLIPGIELIHVNDVEFLDHKIVGVFFMEYLSIIKMVPSDV